ncbi:glycosyltransferase [Nocardioides lianchengensis]|uniref:Glycosyltransferase involved in cell wall bisynthesis n=1 Tax=Nocardioides lianchengensis TaxID=1045774 RepID=A0A1G7AXR2_9ACTN|nr:glycosyltransferase [Nocardioides lianchengensis]NYG13337.1 glycosyltransferase involved in cell wall biosynthesis [Nocardioides lianchengensis]SDE19460.1 Glycosyltransferase involved in cell wall bisynthesis [Nocardioides lianchengensis]
MAVIGTRGYPSYYGGFETAVRRLAPYLADRGWRVRVYGRPGSHLRPDKGADPRIDSVMTKGIDSRSLSTLTYGLFSVLHAVIHKPDVALVMNVANGYWLPLLKLRGIPTVVNVDGIEWERDKWSRLGKAVFRTGARFTAWFADQLVFDALAIGDYWQANFGRTGVFIPYGGDPASAPGREPEFTPGGYVLLVARFVPENSVGIFLEAAPSIIERNDVEVVLVGSAPAGDPLQNLADSVAATHPRVHLLGHISDDERLFDLWRNAGAYFHGHTVGGTNPALVQAMALGARTVARGTVYNREVLGEAGTYCTEDVDSVIETVGAVLTDERDLSVMAIERARAEYTWEIVCARYEETIAALQRLKCGNE